MGFTAGANPVLIDVVSALPADTAPDLGCGEGADPNTRFPTPGEPLAALDLDPKPWRIERLGAPESQATGSSGKSTTVIDNVIALTRLTR